MEISYFNSDPELSRKRKSPPFDRACAVTKSTVAGSVGIGLGEADEHIPIFEGRSRKVGGNREGILPF